jgi:NADH-quinone oxidoreductase subunit E
MLPPDLREGISKQIAEAEHPREKIMDVMYALQNHYGYMTDDAVLEAAEMLDLTPLEVEELATFYNFIYREPVGKFVIHVCDSTVCWMHDHESITEYLCAKLNVEVGEVTRDGLFSVLPVCCIGYCDMAPAMLVNRKAYGNLTPERIDGILRKLQDDGTCI